MKIKHPPFFLVKEFQYYDNWAILSDEDKKTFVNNTIKRINKAAENRKLERMRTEKIIVNADDRIIFSDDLLIK